MTHPLDESLKAELSAMEAKGTRKSFRHITSPMDTEVTMAEKAGRILVLSSNNYLGLADHPEVVGAAKKALRPPSPSSIRPIVTMSRTPSDPFQMTHSCLAVMPPLSCTSRHRPVFIVRKASRQLDLRASMHV